MARRARLPLNNGAVQAADDQFYANHPELVQNGERIPLDPDDPAQAHLRREWMDLYAASGGAIEGEEPVRREPADPVQPCPECGMGALAILVVDEIGIPVPGALVVVDGLGELEAGQDGIADFGTVEADTYPATAEKAGYRISSEEDGVEVPADASVVGTVVLARAVPPITTNPDDKIVYLTFDDGPEAGTAEVYGLLRSLGVRGTFFLVGENAAHYEQHVAPGFLNRLYADTSMQTANHSHTHAHQFYSSFYDTGLRVHAVTLEPDSVASHPAVRRSVLMDFEYASIAFTAALTGRTIARPTDPAHDFRGTLDLSKLTGHSRWLPARMPGSNIWRLPGISKEGWNLGDRLDEANELQTNGYRIYGWDDEFGMNFQVKEHQRIEYEAGRHGHLDLYDARFIDLDRPNETGEAVFDRVKGEFDAWFPDLTKPKKLVLLMHEREFRRYRPGQEDRYLDYLRTFITRCQAEGYKFDIVANY